MRPPYDVIFCRNLLIYFDRPTQDRAVRILRDLLASDGTLFVAPSETGLLLSHSFDPVNWPMAFAFRHPAKVEVPQPSKVVALNAPKPKSRVVAALKSSLVSRFYPRLPSTKGTLASSSLVRTAPANPGAPAKQARPASDLLAAANDVLEQARDLANRGETDAARDLCETFMRSKGPSAQALYLLGLLHDTQGETGRAIERYRGAIYLEPTHQEALVHLAVLLEQDGDPVSAQRLLDRARKAAGAESGRETT